MLYRGIEVTYESIREWCEKFGQQYANQLGRKRTYIADKWHLDEVVVTIKGQQYYLWRAVDAEGNVLDVLLQRQRDTKAAERFFRQLLKKQGFTPRVIITAQLKSYAAAKKQVLKGVEHRYSQGLEQSGGKLSRLRHECQSDECGNSNPQGKRARFLSTFGPIHDHFHPRQHQLTAQRYREQLRQRFC